MFDTRKPKNGAWRLDKLSFIHFQSHRCQPSSILNKIKISSADAAKSHLHVVSTTLRTLAGIYLRSIT